MRIAFLGTPDFAVPSLKALYDSGYDIAGVFSQPDRPQGRKQLLSATPVKSVAESLGLKVFQFERIRSEEGVAALKSLDIDLMVTAAFGQILSGENLAVPRLGCVNVHASLLPKYRGAAPIQWAIIKGETETGITTMLTDIGLDTGDIIMQQSMPIGPEETAGELFERLAALGADTLLKTLRAIEGGTAQYTPQNDEEATHFPMLKKEDGKIDFSASAGEIANLVRGTNPWPVAYARLGGNALKIYKARAIEGAAMPGLVAGVTETGFTIGTGHGLLEVLEVQSQGKKRMPAADFVRGWRGLEGSVLE